MREDSIDNSPLLSFFLLEVTISILMATVGKLEVQNGCSCRSQDSALFCFHQFQHILTGFDLTFRIGFHIVA